MPYYNRSQVAAARKKYRKDTRANYMRGQQVAASAIRNFVRIRRKIGMAEYKLRTNPDAVTDVAGQMSYLFSTTNPELTTSINGGAFGNAVQDWTSVISLYDQYRVCAIKVRYTPDLPNDTSVTTSFKPVYIVTDFDSTAAINNYNTLSQYEMMKVKNLFQPWSYYIKLPKSQTAGTIAVGSFGWHDMAAPDNIGTVQIFAQNLDASTTYGRFTVTYYVKTKNRR